MADGDSSGSDRRRRHRGSSLRPRRRSPDDERRRKRDTDEARERPRTRDKNSTPHRRRKSQGHSRSRSPGDKEYIRSRRYSDHRPYRSPDPRTFKRSHRSRSRSHSPSRRHRRKSLSGTTSPQPRSNAIRASRSSGPLPSQEDAFNNDSGAVVRPEEKLEKQKPNWNTSGKLAAETNTVSGTDIILKYNEPPESRKPSQDWRLYVFKGQETLETVSLAHRSCWLFGRERSVVDFPTEHPSCSKQHAVLQFRYLEKKNEYGDRKGQVKPYVIDLESANGTRINSEKIPEKRFVEVRNGDVITFGESSREYVVMLAPAG